MGTIAEILILYLMWREVPKVAASVADAAEAKGGTVYGTTDDLVIGDKVVVLEPKAGLPRNQWEFSNLVYIVRSVDKERGRALATPVLSNPNQPTPTVEGPMSGPLSPFKKL